MIGDFLSAPQRKHCYFGPYAHPAGEAYKAQSAVNVKVAVVLFIQTAPSFITEPGWRNFNAGYFNAKLHAMRMAGKGKMDMGIFVIHHFLFPVRRVMRQ